MSSLYESIAMSNGPVASNSLQMRYMTVLFKISLKAMGRTKSYMACDVEAVRYRVVPEKKRTVELGRME